MSFVDVFIFWTKLFDFVLFDLIRAFIIYPHFIL